MVKSVLLLLGCACVNTVSELVDAPWHVGVGIADCTGPAAEVVMMGYADNNHKTAGIHMRLYARAFVFVDPSSRDRMAFVNVDTWAATEAVIQGVEEKLHAWFQGRYYSRNNLIIAGSHTHHGPAGASAYMLFQFSSNGKVQQSLDALIDGISEAVWLAHHDVRPAEIFIGSGLVDNSTVPNCPMPNCASRNRSPTSFRRNPEEQRKKYFGDDNVDRNMDLLKIVDAKTGKAMGSLNWFAVHPTSMTSEYHLISGDNKGYAAYAFEQEMNGPTWVQPAGRGPFVAGFAQGVSGDISPNTRGDYCKNTGKSCENQWSVCWDQGQPKNELCLGQGPGRDNYESMKIIGERQVTAAKTIFERATEPLGSLEVLGGHYRQRHVGADLSANLGLLLCCGHHRWPQWHQRVRSEHDTQQQFLSVLGRDHNSAQPGRSRLPGTQKHFAAAEPDSRDSLPNDLGLSDDESGPVDCCGCSR